MRDSDPRGAIAWLTAALLIALGMVIFIVVTVLAPPEVFGVEVGSVLEAGGINQADRSHGDRYLAIRAPRGTIVRVCGPADCIVMRSTDYGPKAGTGKIADLAVEQWLRISGLDEGRGVVQGSIEYPYDGPSPTLPPTDVVALVHPAGASATCEHITIAAGDAWITKDGYYPHHGELLYGPVGAGTYALEPSYYYVIWSAPSDFARQKVWVPGCNPGYPSEPPGQEPPLPDATLPPTDVGQVAIAAAETLPIWRPTAIAVLVLIVMGLMAYATAARSSR